MQQILQVHQSSLVIPAMQLRVLATRNGNGRRQREIAQEETG